MIASAPNQPWTLIELTALVLAISLPFVFFPFSQNAVARVGFELSAVRARRRRRRSRTRDVTARIA